MKNITNIRALILEDNPIIGTYIQKRMLRANTSNFLFSGIEVTPYFLPIDIKNLNTAALQIANYIQTYNVTFLLIDRGFYNVIDPVVNKEYGSLDHTRLYTKKEDLDNGIKIEEILKLISKDVYKNIKGLVIYTYDAEGEYVEPEQIKQMYLEMLYPGFDKSNINVLLANSETYKLANLNLYIDKPDETDESIYVIGRKSDFKLYGLFMGEILYHRVISIVNKRNVGLIRSRQKLYQRNLFFLFIIFSALNIGANATYSLLSNNENNDIVLIIISVVMSLFVPLFLLAVKPEYLIDIEQYNHRDD